MPHEGEDLLLDARRLVDRLRADGRHREANNLDLKIKTAKAVLISLAGLAGAYYIGTKVRAGKLLLMWGWNAAGPGFNRLGARLERLLPQVDDALRDVMNTAKPHVPPAGSGIDWKVLDQIIDETVPAQLDDASCGPACIQMVLRDSGIDVAQDELIRRARATIHPEIKSKRLRSRSLGTLLRQLDSAGKWQVGQPVEDAILNNRTPRQIIEHLGRKGSWIAHVGTHFVVDDGFDKVGYLRIRDPWYEPGWARGIRAGTHYRVSLKTFFDHWFVDAVYRN